jgi:hypothetical protein
MAQQQRSLSARSSGERDRDPVDERRQRLGSPGSSGLLGLSQTRGTYIIPTTVRVAEFSRCYRFRRQIQKPLPYPDNSAHPRRICRFAGPQRRDS